MRRPRFRNLMLLPALTLLTAALGCDIPSNIFGGPVDSCVVYCGSADGGWPADSIVIAPRNITVTVGDTVIVDVYRYGGSGPDQLLVGRGDLANANWHDGRWQVHGLLAGETILTATDGFVSDTTTLRVLPR